MPNVTMSHDATSDPQQSTTTTDEAGPIRTTPASKSEPWKNDGEGRVAAVPAGHRASLAGSAFGGARGRTDVPWIVEWYMDKKINIDDLITHTLPL
jgi:Zn-dependent alcohol dehydrogenase